MSPLELKLLENQSSKKNKQVITLDNDHDEAIDRGTESSIPVPPKPLTPPPPAKKTVSFEGVRAVMMKKMAVNCTRCNGKFLTALGLLNHQKAHERHSYKRPIEDEKIDGYHDRNPKAIKSDHRHHHDQRGTETLGTHHGVAGANYMPPHGRLVQGYGQGWLPVIVGPMIFPPSVLPPHYRASGEGGFWPPTIAGFNGGMQSPVGQSRVLVADQTIVQTPRTNSHVKKNSGNTSTELDLTLKL